MSERSAEYERLLRLAVQQKEEEERRMTAMTPEERHRYIEAWAKRIAPRFVEEGCALDRELNGQPTAPVTPEKP